MRKKISALAVLATASVFALTGCSAGEQSVADACKVANETMSSMQSELTTGMSELTSNPSGAADLFTKIEEKIKEAESKVTNPQVKTVLSTVVKDFGSLNAVMQKLKDGDLTAEDGQKMTEVGTSMQKSGQELSKLCGA